MTSRRAEREREVGRLYVVATPIGNLGDLSPRARDVLREVDIIAAEDTRVTRRLLDSGPACLVSYREQNEAPMAEKLVAELRAGRSVALVTDAGTPTISDPGYRLVRAAAAAGVEVVAVPGPCAVVALLSIAGLPTDRFAFEGFLPSRKQARRRALEAFIGAGRTAVFYESPRRIVAMLKDVADVLADPPVAVGRELTKLHEEVLRGRASEVAAELEARESVRGEFAVAVYIEPASRVGASAFAHDDAALRERIRVLLAEGKSVRDVAEELRALGISRRRVYEIARRLDED